MKYFIWPSLLLFAIVMIVLLGVSPRHDMSGLFIVAGLSLLIFIPVFYGPLSRAFKWFNQ